VAKPGDKSIDAYRAKRDFARTPEPPPNDAGRELFSADFVVHRHEARRLHYDLRLEMDGVLKSWAVPKGFSYDPLIKKFAVQTEDHPLAYSDFHGVIPKGEYGGGTMVIWDQGRYELLKTEDGPEAVANGKLEFRLMGAKLRGEWHLVKTRSENHEWILFKAQDRYARGDDEAPPLFDLTSARHGDFPNPRPFMEARADSRVFSDPDWFFELDFAGKRASLIVEPDRIRIEDREGADLSLALPELVEAGASLRCERALLDGVLVATDEQQRPSRSALDARLAGTRAAGVSFYAFDLLYYEEWELTPLPLVDRKKILSTLIPEPRHILFVDHVHARGEDFCAVAKAGGLPAVIAKKSASLYVDGASRDWRRIQVDSIEVTPPARKIPFTNLDKVFWPEESYTKGDLIRYYEHVADAILPYLRERPSHMLRYPDGIYGKAFYQKDAPAHIPDWVETESIPSGSKGESIRYIIVNDRDTLVLMANLASIDIHPWFSRRSSKDSPDWAVFDLDPDGSPFPDVVRIARTIGRVLRGMGLRPYLKTSGATGLHIYVPVKPGYTYEQTKTFCEAVSIFVAKEHPDIATVERVVSRRKGKVYIDFLQNRKGQTIVPAYAVRPRPKAPVSAPLDWDELELDLDPTDYTIKTMPGRLEKRGDLFEGALRDPQDLLPAIELFQKNYLDSR